MRVLQDITGLPGLASKTQSKVQVQMWTHSHNGDAVVGSAWRRCQGWSPKDVYLRGRKREAITPGGQGQSERQEGSQGDQHSKKQWQRQQVQARASLKAWLCHLLTKRLWGSFFMSPCLCFPICKTDSQLQTHPLITLSFVAGARTLQATYISALPRDPC